MPAAGTVTPRLARIALGALGVAGIAAGLGALPCHAETPEDSLLAFAVHVARTPLPDWGAGAGIYLGNGLVLTAAHVVGQSWLTRPRIIIGARSYAARAVKEGRFEDVDLTLLAMEDDALPLRLRLRHLALCRAAPSPGEEVITVTPEAAVRSHVIAPERLPPEVRRFNTAIGDVARTGNSGSGVFDARRRCLLGIMSRKISLPGADHGRGAPRDIAKYFVPASSISAFMPAGLELPAAAGDAAP